MHAWRIADGVTQMIPPTEPILAEPIDRLKVAHVESHAWDSEVETNIGTIAVGFLGW